MQKWITFWITSLIALTDAVQRIAITVTTPPKTMTTVTGNGNTLTPSSTARTKITDGTMIVTTVCEIRVIANQIWKRFAEAWQSRGFGTRKIAAQIAVRSSLLPHKHPGVALVSPLGYNVTHLKSLRLTIRIIRKPKKK